MTKWTTKDIKALFPAKVEITEAMITNAKSIDIFDCLGAKTLKKALRGKGNPFKEKLQWGSQYNDTQGKDGKRYRVTTKANIDFMYGITKPRTVTLILKTLK